MSTEWTVLPLQTAQERHPIETPCKGVIIGVCHNGSAFLIHWPKRKGFSTPIDYDMLEEALLTENGFDEQSLPDTPGVYSCIVHYYYDPGDGWERDPEWTFSVGDVEEIKISQIEEDYIEQTELKSS
jgi:hypothetical protein